MRITRTIATTPWATLLTTSAMAVGLFVLGTNVSVIDTLETPVKCRGHVLVAPLMRGQVPEKGILVDQDDIHMEVSLTTVIEDTGDKYLLIHHLSPSDERSCVDTFLRLLTQHEGESLFSYTLKSVFGVER